MLRTELRPKAQEALRGISVHLSTSEGGGWVGPEAGPASPYAHVVILGALTGERNRRFKVD